jgi:hypothetical protein
MTWRIFPVIEPQNHFWGQFMLRLSLKKSTSIFAMTLVAGGMAIAPSTVFAQDKDVFLEVVEDDNGQLIFDGVKPSVQRANIRRNKLKQRANGLFRTVARTSSDTDGTATVTVAAEIQISYIDASGQKVVDVPFPVSEASRHIGKTSLFAIGGDGAANGYGTFAGEKVNIDNADTVPVIWSSPVFGEIPLDLQVLPKFADREDGQMGAMICDGEVVESKVRGCKPIRISLVDRDGDRKKLNLKISGKPEAFGPGPFETALYGEILISAEPLTWDDEDRVWTADPVTITPDALEGRTYELTTKAFNAMGDIIDISRVTGIAGQSEVTELGGQFGRSFITVNEAGNLSFSTSIIADTKSEYGHLYEIVENDLLDDENVEDVVNGVNVTITETEFAKPLLSAQNLKPDTVESFAVWTDMFAIESDNVVDMEYIVGFDVYAPGSDVPELVEIKIAASEDPNVPLTITEIGGIKLGVALWINEDGETFTLRAKASGTDNQRLIFEEPFEGPQPDDTQILLSNVTSDDGGSEFERDSAVLSEAGAQFYFSADGEGGIGNLDMPGGGSVLISAKAGDGEMATMLVNLTVKDVKELEGKAFGFGKGTKKSTTSTSARPELQ